MSSTLSLPNDLALPLPSHSASSLDPLSSPSSASDSSRPKSEHRLSLGVLDPAKFRLSHDFARLVRSPSSVSSKSARTGRTASTHGSRALASDYENEPHTALFHHPVDLDHHDMPPLFADPPAESLPRRAKFCGFLSRSSSSSRSRSKGDTRPSDSTSNESPDVLNATNITTSSTSCTSDSHFATVPTLGPSVSRPRSPSRPLSDNTTTTGETVTPKNFHSRTFRASRPPHHAQSISPHLINDSGIGVNEPLIAYDPLIPTPSVPDSASLVPPTSLKEKRRSKPLFGLPVAPWSRPTTPRDEEISAIPYPPQSRQSKVSKFENWFKLGPPSAIASSSRPIAAPQPHRPLASPISANRADAGMRPHSTPPRIHASRELESSDSERDGRCSPLLGLFSSARGRGKQREGTHDHHQADSEKPVVGQPIIRTRTASREGPNGAKGTSGARLPSFEFERGGGVDARRSTSQNGHRRIGAPHANVNGQAPSHAYRSRGHAHTNSHGQQDARSHIHVHTRSRSHAQTPRSHTHPQPSQHRGTGSPQAGLHSPPMQSITGASAASQSTNGTVATNTTTGAAATGGTGSWGRVNHTADWVRGARVHPPFAFESAASSTASTSGERRGSGTGGGGGGNGGDIRDRERDRDRERSRRHVTRAMAPASPVRSGSGGVPAGTGPGRWEQREVELGLGLTWAPTKIRVREWTTTSSGDVNGAAGAGAGASAAGGADSRAGGSGKEREHEARVQTQTQTRALHREREMDQSVREREGGRRTRERLAEYEFGYTRSARSRKDREVTGRFRDVLGAEGFEAFKKYVRRFDADLIPLEGPSGLLGRVGRLLDKAPVRHVGAREKREMLDDLVRIVRENEW
ncbi:hypothetical protein BJV74DRAFT_951929 [Russula compacta]|nr:hypothetical protein BJV74DRAFT_951929 [Russula compacta]